MLENTGLNRKLLAGAVGVTLTLALAVGAGAVPMLGDTRELRTAAVSPVEVEMAAPMARQPGDVVTPTTEAVPPTTVPVPTTVAPKPAAPATTKAPAAPRKPRATAPAPTAATAPPAASAPAAPVTVARRVPSAAEVNQAIATMPQYVRSPFTPTPAQVDQLGAQVCTAFDQGQTFAQVKATGLSMVTQVPLTTVLAGGADWVVKTAVALYCPGHASKLV